MSPQGQNHYQWSTINACEFKGVEGETKKKEGKYKGQLLGWGGGSGYIKMKQEKI